MSVYEILITVLITASLTVLAAVIIFKLQTRHREGALSRALKSEIEENRFGLDNFKEERSRFKRKEIDYAPEMPILFGEAYEALRLSGELLKLPKNVRNSLNRVMSLIDVHNRSVSEAGSGYVVMDDFLERMDRIVEQLKVLESELDREVKKPGKRSDYEQQDLLRRYITSYVPTFFFFGLYFIYAHYLSKLDTGENMSIFLERLQRIVSPVVLPIGIASITWAIILLIVGLNCKMPRNLKGVREKIVGYIMGSIVEPIFYVASMTVFGVSFTAIWVSIAGTEIDVIPMKIIFIIGMVLTFGLFVNNMISARPRRVPKDEP